MKPTVSVVIASKNYGRYLVGALRSVLAQTWSDLEVILIDDGSSDNTAEVVRPYLSDPRFHYHRTDGLGQPRAKNLGITNARGEFIAFLDGDDEWHETKLAQQMPLFDRPEVAVVYARRTLMDGDGQDLATPDTECFRGRIFDRMLVQNCVCFSSAIVRRQVFDAVGMFDPNLPLAIDYDLWLRVAPAYEFDFVNEPLVRYRTGHGNLSSRLTERVNIILTILRRTLIERGHAATSSPQAQREAFGSTMRTMAWAVRSQSLSEAAKWYIRAATHDRRWLSSVKGIAGAIRTRWRRRPIKSAHSPSQSG